uniref:DNA 3'-5' helicase n=1 Tax=viral metagenome TaxID=1070528 RepID=A0A6H1ZMP7_9ZZZZ
MDSIKQYLSDLNEEQAKVRDIGPGLLAVSGVPGSGKTRSIVARIARLVMDGLDPRYILAMTFTTKAATVMNQRLASLGILGARVGTIHSLCHQLLEEEFGMIQQLELDTGSAEMHIKKVISQMRQKQKIPRGTRVDIGEINRYVEFCKGKQLCHVFGNPFGVNSIAEKYHKKEAKEWRSTGLFPANLYDFYVALEADRATAQRYDFNDMQLWAWMLLVIDEDVLQKWRNRWSVIIVDEAQDSSLIQSDMAFIISGLASQVDSVRELPDWPKFDPDCKRSLMLCSDPAQSLYGWRGGNPDVSIAYATDEMTEMIALSKNYRSRPEICNVASSLVQGKGWHLSGDMLPQREDTGSPAITFSTYDHPGQEAVEILKKARARAAELGKWSGVAILTRLAALLHLVEIECVRGKIPYVKRAGGSFLDSQEVTDILAYLRVAAGADPEDRWIRRCVRRPFKYISRVQLQDADQWAARGKPYVEALLSADLGKKQRSSILQMAKVLEILGQSIERASTRPGNLCQMVMDRVEYLEYLREDRGSAGVDSSKVAILNELVLLGNLFAEGEIIRFLSYVDQMNIALRLGRKQYRISEKDGSAQTDCLVLSTIHSAKGLEWDTVYVADIVQGRFPWNMCHSMDEELRLLYVAVTRGKEQVHLSRSFEEGDADSSLWRKISLATERCRNHGNDSGNQDRSPREGTKRQNPQSREDGGDH